MLHDVLVPLDGSAQSATALGPASALARYLDSEIVAIHYDNGDSGPEILATIEDQLRRLGDVKVRLNVEPVVTSVGSQLSDLVNEAPGRLVCMSTRGRGRAAAVAGSVATDVLHRVSSPLMLVGPGYRASSFRCHGPLLVPVTDDEHARLVVPTAMAFAMTFDYDLEIVRVCRSRAPHAFPFRGDQEHREEPPDLAEIVAEQTGSPPNTTFLNSLRPAQALIDYAAETKAALVAMATTNPVGTRRLLFGSTTAQVIQGAPCPVLTIRPSR